MMCGCVTFTHWECASLLPPVNRCVRYPVYVILDHLF